MKQLFSIQIVVTLLLSISAGPSVLAQAVRSKFVGTDSKDPIVILASNVEDVESATSDSVKASNTSFGDEIACDDIGRSHFDCGLGCTAQEWKFTADALFLNRSDPDNAVLAFNTVRPAEALNSSNYHFGTHTGFDLALRRQIGTDGGIELRYFGVDHWNATTTSVTTPGDLFQLNSNPPVFTFSGTSVNGTYSSALHNAEFNRYRNLNERWSILGGFRYAELNERATVGLTGSQVPMNYETVVRNRLYGFQLGSQATLVNSRRLTIDLLGKAGIYGNQAAQDSTLSTGVVTLPGNGRGGRTSFIGELGLTGSYRFTDHLSFRTGYRLLWLESVALASSQLTSSDFANGTGFDGTGSVFYHGAFAGLELAY